MGGPSDDKLFLLSLGHFHPEAMIDNEFLESLDIGVDAAWIIQRVGIRGRRTVLPLEYIRTTRNRDPRAADEAASFSNAQTGAAAAMMALRRAHVQPKDIGLVIAGGCSPMYSIPAEACMIAAELGIECPAVDLNSACSTFAAQLHMLNSMKREALPDFVLLVSAENNTRRVNYSDRKTAVLWGDGSSAAVVSPRVPGRVRIVKTTLHSNPGGWDKVTIPAAGFFLQDGQAVQSFAIRKSVSLLEELRTGHTNGTDGEMFVGHQANLLMLQSVCRQASIPDSRHLFNVDRYGNCGASGAPTVLSENWEDLPEGAVCVGVVGSGLTWGGVRLAVGPALRAGGMA